MFKEGRSDHRHIIHLPLMLLISLQAWIFPSASLVALTTYSFYLLYGRVDSIEKYQLTVLIGRRALELFSNMSMGRLNLLNTLSECDRLYTWTSVYTLYRRKFEKFLKVTCSNFHPKDTNFGEFFHSFKRLVGSLCRERALVTVANSSNCQV